jgi:UDP-2,3-diacylglucosamine hydrolase
MKKPQKQEHFEILEGAIFIADAHENGSTRANLGKFLKAVDEGEIEATQLFLMGDMFDFIAGGARYCLRKMAPELRTIDRIASRIEVYYFEGNHDYNLRKVFKNVRVFERAEQPALFYVGMQTYALSHGDLNEGDAYELYTSFIRSPRLIAALNAIDIGGWISRAILRYQQGKNIAHSISDFELHIAEKTANYPACDAIVEGHYHQNRMFRSNSKKYINLASFACGGEYHKFAGGKFEEIVFGG